MPFKIVRNDITKMKADAIVNTANPRVRVGRGVDSAIYSAAGWEKLLKEREKIGPMRRGSAAITPAFDLDAKYIIHTVGPRWDSEDTEKARKQLRDCYDNSMSLALEKGVKSIAFPLISTGSYAFPKEEGLKIAYDTISRYLYVSEMDVYLVVYDEEAFSLSKNLMDDIDEFIDSRYVSESKKFYTQELSRMMGNAAMPEPMISGSEAPSYGPLPKERKKSLLKSIFRERKESDEREEYLVKDEAAPIVVGEPEAEYSSSEPFRQYQSLDELLRHSGETFQDRLFRYMDRSGLSDVEVYKGANLSKQTFSKIRQQGHVPKKRTILALALSLKLSLDETRDLLESAGQAFSPSDKIDLTVQYCIYKGIYSIFDVERILFEKFGETLVS